MSRTRRSGYVVIGRNGIPCPRCSLPTEIREHREITPKHLAQPFYFTRWFYCRNPNCIVTLHMSEQFKVRPHSVDQNLLPEQKKPHSVDKAAVRI